MGVVFGSGVWSWRLEVVFESGAFFDEKLCLPTDTIGIMPGLHHFILVYGTQIMVVTQHF